MESSSVYYGKVYANVLIVLGILFTLLFFLGFLILEDVTSLVSCGASGLIIMTGFLMKRKPYLTYGPKEIQLYSVTGKVREGFYFNDKRAVRISNNHIFLDDKKLKANDWFLNKAEWQRMVDYYSDSSEVLMSELKDSSSL